VDNNLFINGIQSPEQEYNIFRDSQDPYETQIRLFMEDLWRKYKPYADKNFRQQIQIDLDSRFWEMYLACTLLDNSIPILNTGKGPDFLIKQNAGRIWIEAIAPTSGADVNVDRVPEMKLGVASRVPDEQIILRYSSAIKEKYDNKYNKYVGDGVIASNDAYVIAINGCKIPSAIMELEVPRILKAVFPIGYKQIKIDTKTGIVIDTGYQFRNKIGRSLGSEVRTDIFLNPKYSNLSGVPFPFSLASVRKVPEKMGEDFVFIHNPLATNGIPKGFLKVGREYFPIEGDEGYKVEITNWS